MSESNINKTIVVSYDDITRMIDSCMDTDRCIHKEFMDWYVNENTFFSRSGMFIVEDILYHDKGNKYAFSYDFKDMSNPLFIIYDYRTQEKIYKFSFNKEDNLSFKDVSTKFKWLNKKYMNKENRATFYSEELNEKDGIDNFEYNDLANQKIDNLVSSHKSLLNLHTDNSNKISLLIKSEEITQAKLLQEENVSIYRELKKIINTLEKDTKKEQIRVQDWYINVLYKFMATKTVYYCYATMYYFAKHKSKEITTKSKLISDVDLKVIKSIYKYTGYININDAKVYVPIIKKNDDDTKREYNRHIQKWSVRGHYRRYNGKIVWVDYHEKGKGELEKRIYGTEKECNVNVLPKIFEVNRNVIESENNEKKIVQVELESLIENNKTDIDLSIKNNNIENVFITKKIPVLKRITNYIVNIFKNIF